MNSSKSPVSVFASICLGITLSFVATAFVSAQEKPNVEVLTPEKGVVYDEEKKVLTDKVTKCSITVPVTPVSKLTRVETPYGIMMVRSHVANLGDMIITLTQTRHPAKLLETSKIDLAKDGEKFVEMASQYGVQRRKGSKVQTSRKLTLQGAPGIEQAIAFPADEKGTYTAGLTVERTYVHNGLLYVVMVDMTKEVYQKDPTAARKKVLSVLGSFAFVD